MLKEFLEEEDIHLEEQEVMMIDEFLRLQEDIFETTLRAPQDKSFFSIILSKADEKYSISFVRDSVETLFYTQIGPVSDGDAKIIASSIGTGSFIENPLTCQILLNKQDDGDDGKNMVVLRGTNLFDRSAPGSSVILMEYWFMFHFISVTVAEALATKSYSPFRLVFECPIQTEKKILVINKLIKASYSMRWAKDTAESGVAAVATLDEGIKIKTIMEQCGLDVKLMGKG